MSTDDIYNVRRVDDRVVTSGQPTEEQLRAAAEEGFGAIVNLAPAGSRLSLDDEVGLVRSLGMAYHHIPVDWNAPTGDDLAAFERVMLSLRGETTLIHCVANLRVTAFYSLYAQRRLGWPASRAEAFRSSVWEGNDNPVWEEFIRTSSASVRP